MGTASTILCPTSIELIDRGIEPGSKWEIRINPDCAKSDGFLRLNVIQSGGQIGYQVFTPAGSGVPPEVQSLLGGLDASRFVELAGKKHFIKL